MGNIRKTLIETERLKLHALTDQDKSDMMRIVTHDEVKKTYMLPDFKSEVEKDTFYLRLEALSKNLERFVYGIYLNDKLIGFMNEVSKEVDTIEIGYFLDPAYWNKGYVTEALKAAIKELFRIGYLHVKAAHFLENPASGRVMQKAGMSLIKETEDIEYRNSIHHCIYYQIDKK